MDDPYAFRFEPQEYILPSAEKDSPTTLRLDLAQGAGRPTTAVRAIPTGSAVVQRIGEFPAALSRMPGAAQHEQRSPAISSAVRSF